MNRSFKLADLLQSSASRMWQDLTEALVPHHGKRGEAREQVLRTFLGQHLPERVGVSAGFVFDAEGVVSRQTDIVIHDRLNAPTFAAAGDARFFPCEAVVAAGEVKSELRSTADLVSALENLKSIKALDRSHGHVHGSDYSFRALEPRANHLDQIFTFVFAIRSALSTDTIRDVLAEHISADDRHLWPNIVFVFDRALITYACPDGVCPNPMHALGIGVVTSDQRERLLLSFFLRVAMAVQVSSAGGFGYAAHLWNEAITGGTIYHFRGQ